VSTCEELYKSQKIDPKTAESVVQNKPGTFIRMTKIDQVFAETMAKMADKTSSNYAELAEAILEGVPMAERWRDISNILVEMLDQLSKQGAERRLEVAKNMIEATSGANENYLKSVAAAVGNIAGEETFDEYAVVHALRGCELVLSWSNSLAGAERVRGGDPIRWCADITERPSHWKNISKTS
jgi:hypothetical protein